MTRLKPTWLTLTFLLTGIIGWIAIWLTTNQGISSPVLPPASIITLSGIGLVNLGLGIWVFLSKRRKIKARVAPLAATRIVLLAQAAAYGGAFVAGWHAGILLYLSSTGVTGSATAGWGIGYLAAGLALVAIGFAVEHLCKVDQDDDEDEEENGGNRAINGIDPAQEEGGYARDCAEH